MKWINSLLLLIISSFCFAQGNNGDNSIFRLHLKFYVVAAVVVIILSLLFAFLFYTDSRLKKLEQNK